MSKDKGIVREIKKRVRIGRGYATVHAFFIGNRIISIFSNGMLMVDGEDYKVIDKDTIMLTDTKSKTISFND